MLQIRASGAVPIFSAWMRMPRAPRFPIRRLNAAPSPPHSSYVSSQIDVFLFQGAKSKISRGTGTPNICLSRSTFYDHYKLGDVSLPWREKSCADFKKHHSRVGSKPLLFLSWAKERFRAENGIKDPLMETSEYTAEGTEVWGGGADVLTTTWH